MGGTRHPRSPYIPPRTLHPHPRACTRQEALRVPQLVAPPPPKGLRAARPGPQVAAIDMQGMGRSEGHRWYVHAFQHYVDDAQAFLGAAARSCPLTGRRGGRGCALCGGASVQVVLPPRCSRAPGAARATDMRSFAQQRWGALTHEAARHWGIKCLPCSCLMRASVCGRAAGRARVVACVCVHAFFSRAFVSACAPQSRSHADAACAPLPSKPPHPQVPCGWASPACPASRPRAPSCAPPAWAAASPRTCAGSWSSPPPWARTPGTSGACERGCMLHAWEVHAVRCMCVWCTLRGAQASGVRRQHEADARPTPSSSAHAWAHAHTYTCVHARVHTHARTCTHAHVPMHTRAPLRCLPARAAAWCCWRPC